MHGRDLFNVARTTMHLHICMISYAKKLTLLILVYVQGGGRERHLPLLLVKSSSI